ncbi:hypothetical protein P4572_19115 [Priestia megaterium]|uniref:hypothetical protein n=1 Tax=Priestia megaterium TaxID=1404 RepID=UPI002E1BC720|nr:hypothetical protein [Priestia megaterium]MED4219182.1 hypothetical protein [Priestia megaterium]
MQTTVKKENAKLEALKQLKQFIQHNNIDLNAYIQSDGNIDLKSLLQDHGVNL